MLGLGSAVSAAVISPVGPAALEIMTLVTESDFRLIINHPGKKAVLFSEDWCPPCRAFKSALYDNDNLRKYLLESGMSLIGIAGGESLLANFAHYRVRSFPQFEIYDGTRCTGMCLGFKDVSGLVKDIDYALSRTQPQQVFHVPIVLNAQNGVG